MTCEWWDGNDLDRCCWCSQPAVAHKAACCLVCDGKGHVGDESEDDPVRRCDACDGRGTVPLAVLLEAV